MNVTTDLRIFLESVARPIFREVLREEFSEIRRLMVSPGGDANEVGSIDLAKEVTGLSKPSIYRLVSERKLPHSRRGNRLFFKRSELLEWIAEGKREERKGQPL